MISYQSIGAVGLDLYVEGFVRNNGQNTTDVVNVTVDWFDEAGKPVSTETAPVNVGGVAPGGRREFQVVMRPDARMKRRVCRVWTPEQPTQPE
jgi:hypothetical protein